MFGRQGSTFYNDIWADVTVWAMHGGRVPELSVDKDALRDAKFACNITIFLSFTFKSGLTGCLLRECDWRDIINAIDQYQPINISYIFGICIAGIVPTASALGGLVSVDFFFTVANFLRILTGALHLSANIVVVFLADSLLLAKSPGLSFFSLIFVSSTYKMFQVLWHSFSRIYLRSGLSMKGRKVQEKLEDKFASGRKLT